MTQWHHLHATQDYMLKAFNNQVVTGLPARLNLKSLEAVRSVNFNTGRLFQTVTLSCIKAWSKLRSDYHVCIPIFWREASLYKYRDMWMTKARHQPHYKYHCHIANFPPHDWEKPRPCRPMQHREGIKEYASISPTSWTATCSIVSPNRIWEGISSERLTR